jgi:8-oxo-dGTP pyrophosphatase MutT (NUDIX family)/protein-tyrosine-phosphatase
MGNTYRSRLAEAYLNSLQLPGVTVKSAGVRAGKNLNGPITSYAHELLHEYDLEKYANPNWTQLGQNQLSNSDAVICMNHAVYDEARRQNFIFPVRTFIWDVPDVSKILLEYPEKSSTIPHIAQKTFSLITKRVNELCVYLKRPTPKEQIDILEPDGTVTGRTSDVNTIQSMGLWHRGVHAAVYTPAGMILFEKRSETIIGNPGLWDMTFGGIVSAGEDPGVTVLRELEEELGIKARPDQVKKLFVWRYNHLLPHYGLHNRSMVHTYLIRIEQPPSLTLQRSEVADAKWLTVAGARDFIRSGHSELGELATTQEIYKRMVEAVQTELAKNHASS